MILGLCGSENRIALAAKNGFSFLELTMVKVRELDRNALLDLRKKAEDAGMFIGSAKQFFAGSVVLYGDASDDEETLRYATRNFETAQILGCPFLAVGSGKARAVPEGMEKARAEERLAKLLARMGSRAADFGVALAVEPLRYSETNLVNTLADGIRVKRMADHPNVGCMVDFFHFSQNGEDLSTLDELRPGELRHVHVARPNPDRCAPHREDRPTVLTWANKLREIGYDGTVSLECDWKPDFESLVGETAEVMRVFLEKA